MEVTTESSELFSKINHIYTKHFRTIRGLSWGERPDYDTLLKDFRGYGSQRTIGAHLTMPIGGRNLNANHHIINLFSEISCLF